MELKSIWDGREKQCFFRGSDGGASCAAIYPSFSAGARETFERVAKSIRTRFDLPGLHIHEESRARMHPRTSAWDTIVYANNVLKLTPEDFRRIDRETQIAAAMPKVEALVESACEAVTA